MKKKLVCLLLVFCMMLTFLPAISFADGDGTQLTESYLSSINYKLTSGSYYLSSEIELQQNLTISGNVTINTKGYYIGSAISGSEFLYTITVEKGANVTINGTSESEYHVKELIVKGTLTLNDTRADYQIESIPSLITVDGGTLRFTGKRSSFHYPVELKNGGSIKPEVDKVIFQKNVTIGSGCKVECAENINITFQASCVNYGTICNANFSNSGEKLENHGTIENGYFTCTVVNHANGIIRNGEFTNNVTNDPAGIVYGGSFSGTFSGIYRVTFDTDGGSEAPAAQLRANAPATEPSSSPSKDSSVFDGWYLVDGDTKTPYTFTADEKITKDTVLTAGYHSSDVSTEAGLYEMLKTGVNKIRLTNSLALEKTLTINQAVELDLNGYELTLKEGVKGSVIQVGSGGNFALSNGTISGGTGTEIDGVTYGGGVYKNGGIFTLKNGAIIRNCQADVGGGIYITNSDYTYLYGTIRDCKALKSAYGDAISNYSRYLWIYPNASIEGSIENYSFLTIKNGDLDFHNPVKNGGLNENEPEGTGEHYGYLQNNSSNIFYGNLEEARFSRWLDATITFRLAYEDGETIQYAKELVATSNSQRAPEAPQADGYTFDGKWYTDEACTEEYTFTQNLSGWIPPSKNADAITLYSRMLKNSHTITYDSGDDTGEVTGSVAAGTKVRGEDATLSEETFTRDGFVQIGWYDAGGNEYDLGATYSEESDITLYPLWESVITIVVPYTTTVNQGGNTAPDAKEFTLEVISPYDAEYLKDVECVAVIQTNGKGAYSNFLTITGPESQIHLLLAEGALVHQINDGTAHWTYSDAVYALVLDWSMEINPDSDAAGNSALIYAAKRELTDNGEEYYQVDWESDPLSEMNFTNVYTLTSASGTGTPSTGDNSHMALWFTLLAVSLCGIIALSVYAKKKHSGKSCK